MRRTTHARARGRIPPCPAALLTSAGFYCAGRRITEEETLGDIEDLLDEVRKCGGVRVCVHALGACRSVDTHLLPALAVAKRGVCVCDRVSVGML